MSLLPQRRRARIGLLLTVALALVLGLRALLPWGLAKLLARESQSRLGLTLQVGNVDLWLLRGRIALEDVTLGDAPQFLRFDRGYLNLAWADLWSQRLRIQGVDLDGARLQLTHTAEGRLEPLSRWTADDEPTAPDNDSAGWPLRVERLSLKDASLTVAEAAQRGPALRFTLGALELRSLVLADGQLSLVDVDLSEPRLNVARSLLVAQDEAAPASADGVDEAPDASDASSAAPAEPQRLSYRIDRLRVGDAEVGVRSEAGPFELSFALEAKGIGDPRFPLDLEVQVDDGTLRFEGEAGIAEPALDGTLTWSDLPLASFALLADPERSAWLRRGRLSGDLELHLDSEPGAALHLSGGFTVADLELADPESDDARLAWKRAAVESLDAELPLAANGRASPPRLRAARLALVDPQLHWVRSPSDVERAGKDDEPTPAPEADSPGPLIRIAALDLRGGDFRFRDQTTSPPFETRLHDIQAGAQALRWPESEAREIDLRGVAPEAARFQLQGSLEQGGGELRLEIARLALPPLDPYARQVGYAVSAGELSLDSDVALRGDTIDAANNLVLHGLGVDALDDSRFQAIYGVSLPLALALLRDPGGDIRLEPPLRFRERRLEVGMTSVIQDALREALQGALTVPLKGLGAVLARGGEEHVDLDALPAAAGEAELAADAKPRIEELARLLESRPGLGLVLHGRIGEADRTVLAERIRTRRREERWLPDVAAGEDAPVDVPQDDLLELARRRAERLQAALVEAGVSPERLRLGEPQVDQPPGVDLELFAR